MSDKVKIDLFKSTSEAIDTYLRFSLLTENPAGDTPRKDAYTCSEKLLDVVKAKIKLIIDAGYLEEFESYLLSENLVVKA